MKGRGGEGVTTTVSHNDGRRRWGCGGGGGCGRWPKGYCLGRPNGSAVVSATASNCTATALGDYEADGRPRPPRPRCPSGRPAGHTPTCPARWGRVAALHSCHGRRGAHSRGPFGKPLGRSLSRPCKHQAAASPHERTPPAPTLLTVYPRVSGRRPMVLSSPRPTPARHSGAAMRVPAHPSDWPLQGPVHREGVVTPPKRGAVAVPRASMRAPRAGRASTNREKKKEHSAQRPQGGKDVWVGCGIHPEDEPGGLSSTGGNCRQNCTGGATCGRPPDSPGRGQEGPWRMPPPRWGGACLARQPALGPPFIQRPSSHREGAAIARVDLWPLHAGEVPLLTPGTTSPMGVRHCDWPPLKLSNDMLMNGFRCVSG